MLPDKIKEDKNLQIYIMYDNNGLIIESWKREPTDKDIKSIIVEEKVVQKPEFYGEWQQLSQEEVDKINKELIEKKKPKILLRTYPDLNKRLTKKLNDYERALIEARRLLEEKLKEENKNENN